MNIIKMNVHIVSINWDREIPIATVEANDMTLYRVSLLHRSYMKKHNIGIRSEIRVSHMGFIQYVITSTGYIGAPPVQNDVFDKWFLLQHGLRPYVPNYVIRILFLNGIETLSELKQRHLSVGQLRGIGPVMAKKIHSIFTYTPITLSNNVPGSCGV
jgi:hypothetical protein